MISESQVVVDLLLGQSKNTDQESSWNYFKLVGEFKTYSYITIKLTLANSAAVILTARKETLPQMINRQLQAD